MNPYIDPIKAFVILEHMKVSKQYFCFNNYNQFYTADELLAIIKGREVSAQETIKYLTE